MLSYQRNVFKWARPFAEIAALALLLEAGERRRRLPSIAVIQAKVCERFELDPADMVSPCRKRRVARPRQVAMYLSHYVGCRSLGYTGTRFGNRDHTTVMHACRLIEALRSEDPDIEAAVRELTEELQG